MQHNEIDFKPSSSNVEFEQLSPADGAPVVIKGKDGKDAIDFTSIDASVQDNTVSLKFNKTDSSHINASFSIPTGPKGRDGVNGKDGKDGKDGSNGNTGLRGPQGAKGDKGDKGDRGQRGDTGPQGPKGDTGVKGADGTMTFEDLTLEQKEAMRGPRGYTGIGEQGSPGIKGDTGARGPVGPTGPAGRDGVNGLKGDTGAQGPQGPQGPQGIQGPHGLKGDTGPQGPQGKKGDSFNIDDSGNLTDELVVELLKKSNGYTFLVRDDLRQDKSTTGDISRNIIVIANGAIDVEGPFTGMRGEQGLQGLPGSNGKDGQVGPQGPQGPQGIQGLPGPKGDTGLTGPKGDKGDTGLTGPKGDKGDTGAQGPQGIQGLKGDAATVNDEMIQAIKQALSGMFATQEELAALREMIPEPTIYPVALDNTTSPALTTQTSKPVIELQSYWKTLTSDWIVFTVGNNKNGSMYSITFTLYDGKEEIFGISGSDGKYNAADYIVVFYQPSTNTIILYGHGKYPSYAWYVGKNLKLVASNQNDYVIEYKRMFSSIAQPSMVKTKNSNVAVDQIPNFPDLPTIYRLADSLPSELKI